jgi:hypothetical protein
MFKYRGTPQSILELDHSLYFGLVTRLKDYLEKEREHNEKIEKDASQARESASNAKAGMGNSNMNMPKINMPNMNMPKF